jgi:hypothetical protein
MNPHAQLGSRYVNPRTENTQHWEAVMPADRQAASLLVLVGRQASPARLNGSLRFGLHIALNDEVIRPWPEPAKNWDHRARKRTGTSPHLCVSRWGQGEPECFLGRRRVPTSLPESVGNVAAMR